MLQRLYVHNFRCLENFEFITKGISSALLIGKNGAGKSTIRTILEIFQSIARGKNRMLELERSGIIGIKDFSYGRTDIPILLEIDVLLGEKLYQYKLSLDLPLNFKELRILEEQLLVSEKIIYSRKEAQISLYKKSQNTDVQFLLDWHSVALSTIQEQSEIDPIRIFRTWLRNMIILAPIPSLMTGYSEDETLLEPQKDGSNFGEWFSRLCSEYPDAYPKIKEYLQNIMPDVYGIRNERISRNFKNMVIQFKQLDEKLNIRFDDLSDGEKCFFLCSVVLAASEFYGPLLCFWDEPDNYLSISEVRQFIMSLRKAFQGNNQILVTSHNGEAIQCFSDSNTFILDRENHFRPTLIKLLSELPATDDVVYDLTHGEIKLWD